MTKVTSVIVSLGKVRESLGSSEVRNSQEGCSEELLSVFPNRSLMKKKGKKKNYCHYIVTSVGSTEVTKTFYLKKTKISCVLY